MKIVILANSDIGLYQFRKELMEELCKSHEVFIVLPEGELIPRLEEVGCKFIKFEFNRRGTNPVADLSQIRKYVSLLRSLKPDIVLSYTIKPNVYGGIACRITHTPYIANVTGLGTSIENGGLLGFISVTLYRIGLKKAGCVFFQNSSNRELFVKRRIVKGNTQLIPGSGVNLDVHNPEPYPSDDGEFRFLFVGRLMKAKGVEELFEAMRRIRKTNPGVILDIVGWSDEDYSEELHELEEAGIVRYHGLQSDVHPFYTACHCVVLPSHHEGMANVMLEASSTGRPVITTRVPGCIETFEEGVTGFGCDARDIGSLTDAMERLLSLPREVREEMGQNARAYVEKNFDRNIIIRKYKEQIDLLALKE